MVAVGIMLAFNLKAQTFWATIDKDALVSLEKNQLFGDKGIKHVGDHIAVVELDERNLGHLSHIMHQDFRRCGGYVRHENLEEALEFLDSENTFKAFEKMALVDYSIDQEESIVPMIAQVDEINIRNTILKLSTFQNRYYKSKTGEESQKYVFDTWAALVQGRNDAKVDYVRHSGWGQPSVVLTIAGASSEVIVVGGHADSIAGWWGGAEARAPGADDNASGVSTMTEIIRVLMSNNYRPNKTIKFMAYAAEEVGLLGSKEIAQEHRRINADVVGVLQLDMTNFNGSNEDIVLMTDFTNEAQNKFVGSLVDKYLPGLKWGYDKCGYGCSDHASWHGQNFPASMPFESRKGAMNRNIHTARDTIDVSGGNASHAVKFAKLGVAFVVELDK